jgi:peptide/nickel transport system permease protein
MLFKKTSKRKDEKYKFLTPRQLIWRKFVRNRIAVASGIVLILLYILILFAGFFSPYNMTTPNSKYLYAPPQRLRFIDSDGKFHMRPFVYRRTGERDPETMRFVYTEDKHIIDPVYFFIQGDNYKFLGLYETNLHFFGVKEGQIFLFGTDLRGRDMLSRILNGGRISLTLCIVGVAITVILGSIIGTLSGYFGGWVDNIIQRLIELIRSFPRLALWMALSAAIPADWPSLWVYFGIVIVLGFIGWTGLARELRGKVLALRSSDFVHAAEVAGANTNRVMFAHMIPNMASHIMVTATVRIPMMIIAESSLSFLGLGIKPPMTSWGLLLSQAHRVQVLKLYPWMLIPGLFIIISVLCFNFVGDGLRDVIDPYAV